MNNKIIKIIIRIILGAVALLFISTYLLVKYVDHKIEQTETVKETPKEKKITTDIKLPESEKGESFYFLSNDEGKLNKISFSFSTTKIHDKYVVILDEPISTDDVISTQVFLATAMTKYHNIVDWDKTEKDPSKVLTFVSLDTPKNQIPKPSGKSVGSLKINNKLYYFSNLLPSEDGKIKGFTFWEEEI